MGFTGVMLIAMIVVEDRLLLADSIKLIVRDMPAMQLLHTVFHLTENHPRPRIFEKINSLLSMIIVSVRRLNLAAGSAENLEPPLNNTSISDTALKKHL